MEIELSSDIWVELVGSMGDDTNIALAAWVSTGAVDLRSKDPDRIEKLISSLIRHRHGTPFEQGSMQFLIECPIFVVREFQRHRVGWSYNEMSGRYTALMPKFWIPRPERGLVNAGTSMRPDMESGDHELFTTHTTMAYQAAWTQYEGLLRAGYAKEVARVVLPVGIYTRFRAQCNPRSLMHFLSLRTSDPAAAVPSYPMAEIEQVARLMEYHFAKLFPITYQAWHENGRKSIS